MDIRDVLARRYRPLLEERKRINSFDGRRLSESEEEGVPGGGEKPVVKVVEGPVPDKMVELFNFVMQAQTGTGVNAGPQGTVLMPLTEMAGGGGGSMAFQLQSGEIVDGKIVYTFDGPLPPGNVSPLPLLFLVRQSVAECQKAGVDGDSIEYLIQTKDQAFKIGSLRVVAFKNGGDKKPFAVVELRLVPDDTKKTVGTGSQEYGGVSTAKGLLSAFDKLKRQGRDVSGMGLVCVDGDGNSYSLTPGQAQGDRVLTFWTQKLQANEFNPDDPEFWTLGDVEAWIRKQNKPNASLFLKGSGGKVFGIESAELEPGRPPTLRIAPWADVSECNGAGNQPTLHAADILNLREAVADWAPSEKERLFTDVEDAFEDSGFQVVDGSDGDYEAEFQVDCDWKQDGDDNLGCRFRGYVSADPYALKRRLADLGIDALLDPAGFDPDGDGVVRARIPVVVRDKDLLDSKYDPSENSGSESKRQIERWADACGNDLLDWK